MTEYLKRTWRRMPSALRVCVIGAFATVTALGLSLFVTAGPASDTAADPSADEIPFGLDPDDPMQREIDLDGDGLTLMDELVEGTDPAIADTDQDGLLDGEDHDPMSRAVIYWGDPELTEGDAYSYPGPSWWLGAARLGGEWLEDGGWVSSPRGKAETGLYLDLDREQLACDLVLDLMVWGEEGALLRVALLDAEGKLVADDVFGNLLTEPEAILRCRRMLPLARFADAASVYLESSGGQAAVYWTALYIDEDRDGLDAQQEAQLGTSDHDPASAGSGSWETTAIAAGTAIEEDNGAAAAASAAPVQPAALAAADAGLAGALMVNLGGTFTNLSAMGLSGVQMLSGGCTESGPYYGSWDCAQQADTNAPGTLSYTNLEVLVDEPITPPTLDTAPGFPGGEMRYWVSYDCPANTNHWETNAVRYVATDLFFDPDIPSSITNASTNVYAANVVGQPISLAGWWPGEDSTEDVIWTNNAALSGSVTYATAQVGKGFQFSNTGQYVEISASTELGVGKTPGLSFECWLKPTTISPWQPIFEWKKSANTSYGAHLWMSYSGNLAVNLYDIHDGWHYYRTYTPPMHTNSFQHIAVTYDHATGASKLYHDAVQVASASLGTFVPETSSDLMLGRREGAQNWFHGIIDEPSVYHCALSSNDIVSIYNAGSAGKQWNGSPTNGAAIPDGCICSPVTNEVAEVRIAAYADTDGDLMPDWWEVEHGLNPTSGVSDDLAAWWTFDEGSGTNVANAVSSNYHGHTVGMTSSNWVTGMLEGALSFDGSNDAVEVSQSQSGGGAVITGDTFTVSAWVWLEGPDTENYMSVLSDMNNSYNGYWLGLDEDSPAAKLGICFSDASSSYGKLGETDYALFTNQWIHIAGTCDGTNKSFYLDGEEVETATTPGFEAVEEDTLYIGSDKWDDRWTGMIDDLRIYTTALASNQVATIYDALQDPDGDGRTNLEEYELGSDPFFDDGDDDGDGLPNGLDAYPNQYDTSAVAFTITSPSEGTEY